MAHSHFNPDDVLVCTPLGVRATSDPNSTLAPGFREVLRAINGKRAVKDLQSLLPQVDPLKIAIWLDDARRMDLIKIVAAPVEEAAKPGAAFEYGAYIEKDEETAALARDIARWAKLKPQSGARSRISDLHKTVQMATLQSGEALESLANSGVFTTTEVNAVPLMEEAMFPPIVVTPPAGVAAAPAAPVAPMAQRYALIAEDDIAELGSLAGLLGAAGYAVRAAGTRKQFIDEMNQPEPASVIFLKLESTVLDTFKTLDRIRAHPQLGSIPVVISGAAPSREEIAKSILLGASGWVVRPYTREKVAAALHGALTPPR